MTHINNLIIEGIIANDPRLVSAKEGGSRLVRMDIANHRSYRDASGAFVDDVMFIPVLAWGTLANQCENHIRKGMTCRVVGRLKMSRWQTREGEDRRTYEIVASYIEYYSKLNPEKQITLFIPEEEKKNLAEPQVVYEF